MTHQKALVLVATTIVAFAGTALAAPPKPPPSPSAKCKAALNRVLPDINFSKVALEDALDFIRDSADVNMHVNWKALDAASVSAKTPVDLRLKSVSVRKVLNVMLSDLAEPSLLIWYVEDGVLEITTRDADDLKMITIVYDMMDLLHTPMRFEPPRSARASGGVPGAGMGYGNGLGGESLPYGRPSGMIFPNGRSGAGLGGGFMGGGGGINRFDERQQGIVDEQEDVMEMIKATTDYKIWKDNGGKCTMHFRGGTKLNTHHTGQLIVTAPRWVHEKIGGSID